MNQTSAPEGGSPGRKIAIRRLEPREWRTAFPIMAQLRTHLAVDEFVARVDRQSFSGYELIGAFADQKLVGVLGMRPVHTLARGAHLHVDDLVVVEDERRSAIGRMLMEHVEREAETRGINAVFLDARPEAVPFYKSLGFSLHHAPSMRKLF